MVKAKLRFNFEREVEKLDDDFFDSAIACLQMMRCMHNQGVSPESIIIGSYSKEVYGYIDVTELDTEPASEE